ncbi:MAG TPA: RagB/SusD family nutrient uptake outer membrane protein [Bacteroidota bacterium]
MKMQLYCLLLVCGLGIAGCTFDIANPNSPSEDNVLTTRDGLFALTVGVQQYYAGTALETAILSSGMSSREVVANSTFLNLIELEQGGSSLPPGNGNVLAMWSRHYRVIDMADQLIANAPNVDMDNGTRSGILATAYLFKAMALGNLAQSFEQMPLDVQADGKAPFRPRSEALSLAVTLCEQARDQLAATPVSAEFTSKMQPAGFNLTNTVQARLARYSLLAGVYTSNTTLLNNAVTAANAVTTQTSVFPYDTRTQNPVYNQIVVNNYAPRDSLGTPLFETGDGRLGFWTTSSAATSNPSGYGIETVAGFFATSTTAIPAFLPGEMRLIRAEVYARTTQTANAVAEIDSIRMKTAAQDPYGIGANLAAYSGPTTQADLLTEIYRQRCAELYLQGVRFEDSRRLNRPGPPGSVIERNRDFYPYPQSERDNNPNTPADPAN